MSDLPKLRDLAYFHWLPAERLHVDQETYQRNRKPKLVRRIITNFNPRALGTLVVGARLTGHKKDPERYYIEDGQQRWDAVMQLDPGYELACLVYPSSVASNEANDFVAINHNRISLTNWEIFRARLGSDDRSAPAIKSLIEQHMLELRLGPGSLNERQIACSSALDYLYSRGHLPQILAIVVQAWGRDRREAFTGHFLRSVDSFMVHYALWNDNLLLPALRTTEPATVALEAQKIAVLYRTHRIERVLVAVYNEHVRAGHASRRLREWDLQTQWLKEEAAWKDENISKVVTLSPFMPAQSKIARNVTKRYGK